MPKIAVNNTIREMTAEETNVLESSRAEAVQVNAERLAAKEVKEANRASVKAKLETLGLTTDEIQDTFGLFVD